MSTKSKKNLDSIFEFETLQEKYRNDAEILMFRFLSEVEKLMESKQMNKKQLAEAIGTSSSYITQLFRGNKLINLTTLAKIQDVFGIKFMVTSCDSTGIVNSARGGLASSAELGNRSMKDDCQEVKS